MPLLLTGVVVGGLEEEKRPPNLLLPLPLLEASRSSASLPLPLLAALGAAAAANRPASSSSVVEVRSLFYRLVVCLGLG